MTVIDPPGATVPGVTHHLVDVNGTRLHYVAAGSTGSPILLVHGWPETWWAFRRVIPLLAQRHQVFAVDLRGFGDSDHDAVDYDVATSAEDLHHLVDRLGVGPVHLLGQDISGGVAFRFAATRTGQVVSFTAVETTLAGFGMEALADVNHGGSWHVGFLGAPGIPELLLAGHERELLADWAFPLMTASPSLVTDADIDEFTRTYAAPHGWRGTAGLYQSVFADGGAMRALVESRRFDVPVLAVDSARADFTAQAFGRIAAGEVTAERLEGAGHVVAQEAPEALAAAVLRFVDRIDGTRPA